MLQCNQGVQARENQQRVAEHLVDFLEEFLAFPAGSFRTHLIILCGGYGCRVATRVPTRD